MEHLKILDEQSNDNELIIEGYLALYDGTDLTGERFTKSTQFESEYTRQNAVLIDWEHGYEPDGKGSPGRDDILGKVNWETAVSDDTGLLVQRILDRRNSYVREIIEPLARAELLASSSEAVPSLIQKTISGDIQTWPVKRDSFTVTPAEPRLLTEKQMQIVKSVSDKYPALKSIFAEAGQETGADSDENAQIENGENNMPDENENKSVTHDEFKAALDSVNEKFDKIAAALDKIPEPKKATVIHDETDKQLEDYPYKFGLFLQATRNVATSRPLTKQHKAILGANESVPSEGGFLVGTEQETAIEKKMHDSAVFVGRANNRTIGQGANSVDFYGRKENSRANGSRYGGIRGYRVAEGQTITASDMNWYKYTLKPEKYAVLAYATDEIVNDTALLQAEILEAAPQELAFMLDDDMLNGSAAGYPQGILNANCLVTVAKESGQDAATFVFENAVNMYARMWARSLPTAAWFVNQDVFPQLPIMNVAVGTSGQLVFMPPGGASVAPYGSLFGLPIIPTEFNATLGTVGDVILADWSQYKLANKGGIQSASSMHVQFVTDQMAWRFTSRYDGQATWESALTPFKGTNTQSPFIALATRA